MEWVKKLTLPLVCHFISRKNATERTLSSTNTQSERIQSASGECLDSISRLHYYNYFVWHKLKSVGRQKLGSPSKFYTRSNSCRTTPKHQGKPGQKNPAHNLEGVTRHGGDEETAGEGGILLGPGRSLGNRRQKKLPWRYCSIPLPPPFHPCLLPCLHILQDNDCELLSPLETACHLFISLNPFLNGLSEKVVSNYLKKEGVLSSGEKKSPELLSLRKPWGLILP